ncbi:MAG: lysophospholipid acyltransferase family protein [Bacteroidota bacterium]
MAEKAVEAEVDDYELRHIPKSGAFVVVTIRRQPGVDELVLLHSLLQRREQFRLLAKPNHPLHLAHRDCYINPPQEGQAKRARSVAESLARAVEEGRSVGVFIDYLQRNFRSLKTREQLKRLFKTIRQLHIPILPVHLDYDKQQPQKVRLRFGRPINVEEQRAFRKSNRLRKFIQSKIDAMGSALEVQRFYFNEKEATAAQSPIAATQPREAIEQDISRLSYSHLISSQGSFDILLAKAKEIPHVIKEIGRLREITFRAVSEGTGKDHDLDEYDLYYEQLFIWDREARKIVGGYRLGRGDEIFKRYGAEGFYIHSLFKIKKGFFPIMNQAVELGRSFIVEEYQRKRLPLFLLWRGILFFLLRNPQYRYLYGPLSISKHYSDISKSLIVEFVKMNYYDDKLARYLTPRKPFEAHTDHIDLKVLLEQFDGQLVNLDSFIEDIEPNHFKIPVLMKQYIKQNARFISFNVDPNFSDALDGFMILDLKDVPYSTIEALKKEI